MTKEPLLTEDQCIICTTHYVEGDENCPHCKLPRVMDAGVERANLFIDVIDKLMKPLHTRFNEYIDCWRRDYAGDAKAINTHRNIWLDFTLDSMVRMELIKFTKQPPVEDSDEDKTCRVYVVKGELSSCSDTCASYISTLREARIEGFTVMHEPLIQSDTLPVDGVYKPNTQLAFVVGK